MKHIISALVENEFGVLARISGMFSSRGFNIQSLTVAETLNPKISRMTIVSSGDDAVLEQMVKQLDKLVNVIKILDVTREKQISRTLALVKVGVVRDKKKDLMDVIQKIGGETLAEDSGSLLIELRGDEVAIRTAIEKLKPFGILEFAQTGTIAMQKGASDLTHSL